MSSSRFKEFQSGREKFSSFVMEFEEMAKLRHHEEESDGTDDISCFDMLFSFDEMTLMGTFIRTVVRCILHECLDQLYVLRNINSQDKSDFGELSLEYLSLEDRYMGSEDHAEYRINSTNSSYAKLAKNINILINILNETSSEIGFGGTFTALATSMSAIKRMYNDERELLEEYQQNERTIKDLRLQREEERLSNIHTMEVTNAKIQKLRFEVEDVLVYGKYEMGYFENWEQTRREQNTIVCEVRENVHGFTISSTRSKIDVENRCHMELENYIEESKNDYLDEIQFWMKYYDDELERREAETVSLKADMEKLVEDHTALKQKFDSHKAEIEDWLEYKRVKREKEELERLQLWAAIKIQSWWRGTMVRKKLGPYRKKGKGKDKDKKGKKK